jgi:hypothetical protein
MENDANAVGADAPIANSKMVKSDLRPRANFRVARENEAAGAADAAAWVMSAVLDFQLS